MFEKGSVQKVSEGSTALQANGDINITNGLSAADVIQIFDILFQNQFPKLQQVAKEQAIKNSKEFEAIVINDLHTNSEKIIIEKFKDPDVQALLNDALMSTARKGRKSHPDLLSRLIVEKVSAGNSDFQDIVLTEAVDIIPKLTKEHIVFICGVFILKQLVMQISFGEVLYLIERFHIQFEEDFGINFNLSEANLNHISYTGACNINQLMGMDVVESFIVKYKMFGCGDLKAGEFKLKALAPATYRFLERINTPIVGGVYLTSVGRAIAITALHKLLPLEYSTWIS